MSSAGGGADPAPGRTWIGIAHRRGLDWWLRSGPRETECLEVDAEEFYKGKECRLRAFTAAFPLFVRADVLSPGSPGGLDAEQLEYVAQVVQAADPLWVSTRVGFRRAGGADFVRTCPLPRTRETLEHFAENVRAAAERLRRPLLVENLASPLRLPHRYDEPEFLNRICERAGCGVGVDVSALLANERDLGVSAEAWLAALEPARIVQLHVDGPELRRGRTWELVADVVKRGTVRAIVARWQPPFPPVTELSARLLGARAALDALPRATTTGVVP